MAVRVDGERHLGYREAEGSDADLELDPLNRAKIQIGIVAQREELRTAMARVLRERWRRKAATGLADEDARGSADWLEVLAEHALGSVGGMREADRQFALVQVAAVALAALEAGHRRHGEQQGEGELAS